jgi:hypothetical protein
MKMILFLITEELNDYFQTVLKSFNICIEGIFTIYDSLCGLVVRVPGYRSRGPGSILDATKFSEKKWVWNGVHSAT